MPESRLEIVADEFLTSIDHYDEDHIWVMNWRLELEIQKCITWSHSTAHVKLKIVRRVRNCFSLYLCTRSSGRYYR